MQTYVLSAITELWVIHYCQRILWMFDYLHMQARNAALTVIIINNNLKATVTQYVPEFFLWIHNLSYSLNAHSDWIQRTFTEQWSCSYIATITFSNHTYSMYCSITKHWSYEYLISMWVWFSKVILAKWIHIKLHANCRSVLVSWHWFTFCSYSWYLLTH